MYHLVIFFTFSMLHLHHLDGIAVDWVNNKIYFTDVDLDIVGVFDPVRFHYRVLVRTGALSQPRAVILDPNNRYNS